jgi:hypothetical protein
MMRGHYFDRFADRQAVNVNEQVARLDRIAAFYNEIDKMFIPYMRNDQRMPLWWWSNVSVSYERWIRAAKGWLARRRT